MDIQSVIDEFRREWKQDPKNSENEIQVIAKYGKMFNPNNIDNLTVEDFKSFLSFNNNKHWRSLERLENKVTKDMEKLKNSLQILLDETIPIERRIQRIRDKNSPEYHEYFGSAYYTPILLVVYPKKYPVVNAIVKRGLERTGIYPNYDSKPEWVAYPEVIPKIQEIAEKNNASLWQMDSMWYHISLILDYDGLNNFITETMDTRNFYQPLIIRTMIEREIVSKETIDKITRLENPEIDDFVSNKAFEELVDKCIIVKKDDNGYRLNLLQSLTSVERENLIDLCNQEITRIKENQKQLENRETQYFLLQVSDRGSENILKNSFYHPHQKDLQLVESGDILLVYFAKKSIDYKQQLKKIYRVTQIDNNTGFRLSEEYDLNGISLDAIRNAIKNGKLRNVFNRISQQGFNLIKIDKSDYDSVLSLDKELMQKREPSLWLVRAGSMGEGAQTWLNENYVWIGYGGLAGLHDIKDYKNFKEHFQKTHPDDSPGRISMVVPQIWNFIHEIKIGDFVIVPLDKKLGLMAVGKIVGEYMFGELNSENKQYRPVQWLKKDVSINEFDPEIQKWFDNRGTVHHIKGEDVVNKLKDMLKRLGVTDVELETIEQIDNKITTITDNKNDHYSENKWLSLKETDIKETIQNVLTANNKRLEIDENVVKRIISHLVVSKHVILVGPPGTGKTDLARRILRELGSRIIDNPEPIEAVASYEWGRYEVIGGRSIASNKDEGENSFHFGCVTNAIQEKKFLLIDEFNRADMNKAFGEMFLALDHGEIQLREDEYIDGIDINKKILIPSDFRMICTMNDYDKSLLNELSYGLLRRFAFVEINIPDDKEKVKNIVLERVYEKLKYLDPKFDNKNVQLYVDKFIDFMFSIKPKREIGLASYIDVISYLMYSITVMKNDPEHALNDSLIDYILPQFDRLDIETMRLAHEKASEIFIFKDENGKTIESTGSFISNLKRRLERLEELDKLFKFGETG